MCSRKTLACEEARCIETLAHSHETMTRYLDYFIVKLPNSNEYTNVMIVVNQLTKMRHMILLKTLDIIEVAKAFMKNIFKLHELSDTIVSDHGGQFISTF